jgi:S-methylmethionine-dependent homocysteine/selenocysteine methylase
MGLYSEALPQLEGELFLTDGGIETTLLFHDGFDLPEFAAFDILKSTEGTDALRRYFRSYAEVAREHGLGFVLEAATWRASPDWGARIGYDLDTLAAMNRRALALLEEVRLEFEGPSAPLVISGNVGPRGDGYVAGERMDPDEARRYHTFQAEIFADAGADMMSAITMTYPEEAIGIALAARSAGLPVALSFTTETDGHLPSGESLERAIQAVDDATDGYPAYYMVNCAHTSHFEDRLFEGGEWRERIRALRTNASKLSHAELDEAEGLDDGDPVDFGLQHARLVDAFPHLNVLGGCCGTDVRHVREVARAISREEQLVF